MNQALASVLGRPLDLGQDEPAGVASRQAAGTGVTVKQSRYPLASSPMRHRDWRNSEAEQLSAIFFADVPR